MQSHLQPRHHLALCHSMLPASVPSEPGSLGREVSGEYTHEPSRKGLAYAGRPTTRASRAAGFVGEFFRDPCDQATLGRDKLAGALNGITPSDVLGCRWLCIDAFAMVYNDTSSFAFGEVWREYCWAVFLHVSQKVAFVRHANRCSSKENSSLGSSNASIGPVSKLP